MKIALTIGAGTTETHCGDCPMLILAELAHGLWSDPWCSQPAFPHANNCLESSDEDGLEPMRCADCLSAQRAFDDAIRGAKLDALQSVLLHDDATGDSVMAEIEKLGGAQ